MRTLVTGGAGFIGSHLCEALIKRGDEVFVLDDLSTGKFENIEHIKGLTSVVDSVLNQDVVREMVKDVDTVYHLAATLGVQKVVDEPILTIMNNIQGTEVLLEETCRYRKRLLITSTSEVYGKSDREVFREDDDRIMGSTHLSRWSYAASKAIDEFLALAYWRTKRLSCVVVRLFNTVGPRQTGRYGMVIPRFVDAALNDEPITVYGDGEQTRCFASVRDVVPALIALMNDSNINGEIFNIGSTQRINMNDLAKLVIERTKSKSEIVHIPYDQAYGPGYEDMRHRAPSLEKTKAAIGYEPKIELEEILDAVISEMRRD